MNQEQRNKVNRILDARKVDIEFEFVPFSQSRNKDEKNPSLNWRVKIMQNGREVYSTDYFAGIGHIPGQIHLQRARTIAGDAIIRNICETGQLRMPIADVQWSDVQWLGVKPWKGVLAPEMFDVLSSLLLDSDAIDYRDFEDWADFIGYDSDSRSAERIYNLSLKTALALRSIFGSSDFEELRELFSEY